MTFSISPMPNSVSLPVTVTWSAATLYARGYLQANLINLPVFGLYAGYQNQVSFRCFAFDDGSVQQLQYQIATEPYTDPSGVYLNPTIIKARAPGSTLGFNFFIMKSLIGSPVIVDTADAQVRWIVPCKRDHSRLLRKRSICHWQPIRPNRDRAPIRRHAVHTANRSSAASSGFV